MKNILRLPEVQERTGLSRSSIYNYMEKNKFPKSISLGERAVGWLESEIESWISNKVQERKKELDS
ncbi:helix-turn-helix transcriptional regulator [Photobacterium leiognathi]|uniref:helix-turn-helix transcriptional regulator n=1 Tax=Photobacterium leiognathi TaxID=553611 RepID=UPI002982A0F6|nr:AlpA family transcriptional regulator [Photobacterium leiognathi]